MSIHEESVEGRGFVHPGSSFAVFLLSSCSWALECCYWKSQSYSAGICTESCFLILWLLTILLLTAYPTSYSSLSTLSSTSASAYFGNLMETHACQDATLDKVPPGFFASMFSRKQRHCCSPFCFPFLSLLLSMRLSLSTEYWYGSNLTSTGPHSFTGRNPCVNLLFPLLTLLSSRTVCSHG